MHAWESIQSAIDYMEEHLNEDLQIETLANVAALSPFYFQRLFSRLVNKTVYDYIKMRKLSKASEILKSTNTRIVDIAMEYGFSSHSNFTRAFKETFGLTPEQYRADPVVLNHFVKPDLILNYIMVDENIPLITDGMVLEIFRRKLDQPRIFAGIEGEIPIAQLMGGETTGVAAGAKLWEDFHKIKPLIPNLLPKGNELGALYLGNAKEGNCIYMAGAEIIPGTTVPGYKTFEMPACEYLICGFEAETISQLYGDAVFKADKFMERWLKQHQIRTAAFGVEMYYPPSQEAAYLEHWSIPEIGTL